MRTIWPRTEPDYIHITTLDNVETHTYKNMLFLSQNNFIFSTLAHHKLKHISTVHKKQYNNVIQ